jgi:hypothetical protein
MSAGQFDEELLFWLTIVYAARSGIVVDAK